MKLAKPGRWRLVYDPKFGSARKRAAKGFEILAAPPEPDNGRDADLREARDPLILEALRPAFGNLEKKIPKGEFNTRTTESSKIKQRGKSNRYSGPRPEWAHFQTPLVCSSSLRFGVAMRPNT